MVMFTLKLISTAHATLVHSTGALTPLENLESALEHSSTTLHWSLVHTSVALPEMTKVTMGMTRHQ